ncbi:DMT family transporter [Aliishimia ponticola]|uniref:DMT family transporter n=2 Tax=Aliishimia ponticola TaxID=2499833 RepID=A0A4S4NDV7_9RHOB|nr:DMT family transporter [Aliishimia ponticola]
MLVTWLTFAVLDTSAKWAAVAGLPAAQIAFFRYIGHFGISAALTMRDPDNRRLPPQFGLLTLRGLLVAGATLSNFWILTVLPLTVTSAIMFSSPVIVCFLSVTILRENVGLWRWGAILLGFAGVLIVIRPFGAAFHPMMLLALMNAVFIAVYSLITRAMAGKVSTDVMQFWMGFWGTAVTLPLALWHWQAPQDTTLWIILGAVGVLGWFGHQCMTAAHRFATANTLMPFTYSFLLYLTVLSYVVFGHVPNFWTILGALVIMGSGLIIWYREGQK